MNQIDLRQPRGDHHRRSPRHRPRHRRTPPRLGGKGLPLWDVDAEALASASRKLVGEGSTHTVTVNAVIATDLFARTIPAPIDYMLAKIPMGRFGTKEEGAALVAWLCSAECSFSTGAGIDLSGGRATY